MPAGQQGRSERTLESSYTGQESLLRPEPRGSVVVVHAQKKAGAGAAGARAQTHNIHAFIHPESRESRLTSLIPTREEKIKALDGEEKEEGSEGRAHHIFMTHLREGGDMTDPCNFSAPSSS